MEYCDVQILIRMQTSRQPNQQTMEKNYIICADGNIIRKTLKLLTTPISSIIGIAYDGFDPTSVVDAPSL